MVCVHFPAPVYSKTNLMAAFTYESRLSSVGHESLLLQGHQASVAVHNILGFVIV